MVATCVWVYVCFEADHLSFVLLYFCGAMFDVLPLDGGDTNCLSEGRLLVNFHVGYFVRLHKEEVSFHVQIKYLVPVPIGYVLW